MMIDYAPVPVSPATRYSAAVIGSFIMALVLPVITWQIPFQVAALPGWIVLSITVAVFAMNITAAFQLLNAPSCILGDGLVAIGVIISGLASLAAMCFVAIQW